MIKIIQIIGILITIISFIGFMTTTDVYTQIQREVVEVLCLSCLKLDPLLPAKADFTFTTATEEPHPDFVLDNLSSGIVFLHFSKDACAGCDVMLPTIQELFSADY
jgi:thiol-disulfide isomerase/thioredoxin